MVMMSMYGHRVTSEDDPNVGLAIEFMEASTDAITGRWVVDFFPLGLFIRVRFLYSPDLSSLVILVKYLPFMGFRKQAAAYKARIADWIDRPFDSFKDKMVSVLDPEVQLPS